jgi:hypothetical protein
MRAGGVGRLAEQHSLRRSGGLQPGGGVDRIPHHRELPPAIWAHGSEDDLSRVYADADAESAEERGLLRRAALDLERRPNRPLGVVLVGDRRPEHRHQSIADYLVDGAAEPLYDLAHLLHAAVHHRANLLGIGPLGERCEP